MKNLSYDDEPQGTIPTVGYYANRAMADARFEKYLAFLYEERKRSRLKGKKTRWPYDLLDGGD